jgi:ATP-binding cassette subfamily B protein
MLDESTSALDNITQAQIFQTIRENWRGRTVIMIAHRLSTVITADRILFMEKGRILDMGTHQELLGRCAPYKKLYETETLGNGEDDGEDER